MAGQKIKQANIFGRIGSGVGQGLAEQIPKEIERSRLAGGLESLANETGNLTPFQRYAKLLSIPGMTPQGIQSGAELLKAEGIRNSFTGKNRSVENEYSPVKTDVDQLRKTNFANIPQDNIQRQVVQGEKIPADFQNRTQEAKAGKGIVNENPIQEKFIPAIPWTPARRDSEISREMTLHPELSWDQINQRVNDNEQRFLSAPEAYQKQQEYLKGREKEADSELENQLATSLQKEGKDIYGELSGSTLLNMKKAMYNDLATDSQLTPKTAAEKWVKIGKDYVETKNLVRTRAHRDLFDRLIPWKKEENIKALKEAQKSYDKMGNKREFYNMLQSKNNAENGTFGFNLTPGGAALIAYPRTEGVKNVIKNNLGKFPSIESIYQVPNVEKSQSRSRKFAEDFAKSRTASDSILAAAREMKDRNPSFDESAFFDWLRENQDEYAFTPDQKKELITGVSDISPNWGDLQLFPLTGRSKAHD